MSVWLHDIGKLVIPLEETRQADVLAESVNDTGFVTDEKLAELEALSRQTYRDRERQGQPWLMPEEYAMLSIRKGTLSDEEREIMQPHVVMTDKLLSQIHFSPELSHVRVWAAGYHEFINGAGYPRHLAGEEVSIEMRIITILDTFDHQSRFSTRFAS